MALAESLLCGCLPENQDGEFFPQTRPPGQVFFGKTAIVYQTSLRRMVMGVHGEGLPFGVQLKWFISLGSRSHKNALVREEMLGQSGVWNGTCIQDARCPSGCSQALPPSPFTLSWLWKGISRANRWKDRLEAQLASGRINS